MSDQTSEHSADFVLLTRLADEFAERYRRGERPSLAETDLSLGIAESAAAKRYIRALKRLKELLATMPGGFDSV